MKQKFKMMKLVLAGLVLAFSSVVVAAPSTPTLSSPYDRETNVSKSNVYFSWYSSYGTTKYQIIVSENNSFSGYRNGRCDSTCFTAVTTKTSYTKSVSRSGKTYYWTVAAYNSTGWSNTAKIRTFTTRVDTGVLPIPCGSMPQISDYTSVTQWRQDLNAYRQCMMYS
jgi:hypothetical protein